MVSIIIYTNKENFLHKQGQLKGDIDFSEVGIYFWTFSKFPKRLKKDDKIVTDKIVKDIIKNKFPKGKLDEMMKEAFKEHIAERF